ncbi:MAG: hypothetical protein ACREP7_22995, partial [Lysobacter sp.]
MRKAIEKGRITAEADGTIDPARADVEWAASTRPPDGPLVTRAPRARAGAASRDDGGAVAPANAPSGGNTYA